MGTNWNVRSSIWTWGKASLLWGWWSTGTGCSERLWSLLLWRYSVPAWPISCVTCCTEPALGEGVGLGDLHRFLPTLMIPWFCDHTHAALGDFSPSPGSPCSRCFDPKPPQPSEEFPRSMSAKPAGFISDNHEISFQRSIQSILDALFFFQIGAKLSPGKRAEIFLPCMRNPRDNELLSSDLSACCFFPLPFFPST